MKKEEPVPHKILVTITGLCYDSRLCNEGRRKVL